MRTLTEGFFERFYTSSPNLPKVLRYIAQGSAAAAIIQLSFIVPDGYDAIITHGCVRSQAGAAQKQTHGTFQTYNFLAGNLCVLYSETKDGPINGVASTNLLGLGPLHVPSKDYLQGSVSFDAGVAANAATFYLHGFLVPQTPLLSSS